MGASSETWPIRLPGVSIITFLHLLLLLLLSTEFQLGVDQASSLLPCSMLFMRLPFMETIAVELHSSIMF